MWTVGKAKVGDKVICCCLGEKRIDTIERITPTGRITTSDKTKYDKFGMEIGGDAWRTAFLMDYDEEEARAIQNKETVQSSWTMFDARYKSGKLTAEQAQAIIEILRSR